MPIDGSPYDPKEGMTRVQLATYERLKDKIVVPTRFLKFDIINAMATKWGVVAVAPRWQAPTWAGPTPRPLAIPACQQTD